MAVDLHNLSALNDQFGVVLVEAVILGFHDGLGDGFDAFGCHWIRFNIPAIVKDHVLGKRQVNSVLSV